MKEKDVKLSGGLEKQQTQKLIITGQSLGIQFLTSYCSVSEKKLSIFRNEININTSFQNNETVVSLEVVNPTIKLYVMISKWNFDKIESFYKES